LNSLNSNLQPSSPIIEIKNLGFQIDENWIHRNLNLIVFRGEILGIAGGSGCGKTTLLRQILQLEPPSVGSIKILGSETQNATEDVLNKIRQHWGVVFQQGALFSSLTALQNIAFPLKRYTDLSDEIIHELAILKLKLVGLPESAAWKYPHELSGGMQKRVAIARACIMDPTLLFLDEPTAGLDPQAADEFDSLILSLKNSFDLTVVIVTHDLDTLWNISSRVAFLGEGRVLGLGTMSELVKNPQPLIKKYFSGPRSRSAMRDKI
jgi:phospholipid/cholesterol/gamma-HCH transport system ATP-binding protein